MSPVRWWLVVISNITGVLLVSLILALLTWTMYQEYFSEENKERRAESATRSRKKKSARQLSLVMFSVWLVGFLYLFVLLWISLRLLFGKSVLSCAETVRVAAPVYQFTKCIMYGLFIQRISTVYSGSMYAYSDRNLSIGYGIIFVTNSVVVIGDTFLPTVENRDYGSSKRLCSTVFPPWLVALALLIDVFGSLGSLYLFTKPLREMMKITNGKANTLKMTRLAMKYTILTFVAVITTAIHLLMLAIVNQAFFAAIDMVVNLVVFALLTNWYDDYFYNYCQWTFTLLRCCYDESDLNRVNKPSHIPSDTLTPSDQSAIQHGLSETK